MSHPFNKPFIVELIDRPGYETADTAEEVRQYMNQGAGQHRVYVDFELVKRVLLPFAEMHRPGCKEDELACQRGVASDMTIITALDFQQAARLLGPEFEKELKEKYELVLPSEEKQS